MSKTDPIAEQFCDWLDAPPEALARMTGPLAADVQIATQVRQTLISMQPDAQFIGPGDPLGTVLGPLSMGQVLSLAVVAGGALLLWWRPRAPRL